MKRILSLLLVFILALAFLAACDTAPEGNSSYVSGNTASGGLTDISGTSSEHSSEEVSTPPADSRVSFLACADNLIHPSVFYDALERAAAKKGVAPDYSDLHTADYDFLSMYEYVADAIAAADISYLNQETLIGGKSGRIIGYPCFNSPDAVAQTDYELGFDVINVAHNHMLDSGNDKYLKNCAELFGSMGLTVIGYYPTKSSLSEIPVIEKNGIRVAFLSYTYGTNGIKLPAGSETVVPYFSEELLREQVPLARSVADFVIVSCHWGDENTYNTNEEQRKYAALLTELEVDVALGMHPHVIQPMEWQTSSSGHKTLVVYSLGNFLSGMQKGSNVLEGMLSLDIVKDGVTGEVRIEAPTFIPVVNHYVYRGGRFYNDTGYRDFKIYYLSDYTEELAAAHYAKQYDAAKGKTLVGGAFTRENLIKTVQKYIPAEFLPAEFRQ